MELEFFFSYQDFMLKTDRAHMEGIVVAKSVDGEIVGKDGRPRREIREVGNSNEWKLRKGRPIEQCCQKKLL